MAVSVFTGWWRTKAQYNNPHEGKDTLGPCAVLKRTEPTKSLLGPQPMQYTNRDHTDIRKTWRKFSEVSRDKDNVRRIQKTKV